MALYGLIEKDGRTRSGVPLERIRVRGTIKGFTAEVVATMEYNNIKDSPIEAIYVFPLDEGAAVCGFQATIDGRVIVAEVQEKQQARDTYDDAISSGQSAFLLEESDESSDIFQINVGNLPPKQSATVEITFVASLTVEKEGRVVFVLPSVLNPRYTPSDSQQSVSATLPSIASVSTKYSFDFELDVQCATPIQEITSPCNRLKADINPEDNCQATVRLDQEYEFDVDVQVHVLCSKPFEPHALVENGVTKAKDGKTNDFIAKPVVMLNFFPVFDSSAHLDRGEFIFVVDRSGSMNGSEIKSARESLLLFLKSLPDGCYFNVIGFGSAFEKLFTKSEVYNDRTLDQACSHAKSMDADLGGTEILRPLQDVFSQPLIKGYPRQVFLLTDGGVGNTREVIGLVRQNAHKARCFTFGIGRGASTELVKGVARAGKGMADFVFGNEKMQSKVIKMLRYATQPALSDVAVNWDLPEGCSAECVPTVPPPIFSGSNLIMYGLVTIGDSFTKLAREGSLEGTVTLTATLSEGNEIKHQIMLQNLLSAAPTGKMLFHRLAAKAYIQEKQETDLNDEKVKDAILTMSKSMNVISKLTSFVAVDQESHKPVSRPMEIPDLRIVAPRCEGAPSRENRMSLRSNTPDMAFSRENVLKCSRPMEIPDFDSAEYLCEKNYEWEEPHCLKSKKMGFSNLFSGMTKKLSKRAPRAKQTRSSAPPQQVTNYSIPPPIRRDDDSGECYDSCVPRPPEKAPLELVSLQKASGYWQLTQELANFCGNTLDELKKACPPELTADNKDNIWATALALSYLPGKFGDRRDEWEMVAAKGTKWLKKNLPSNVLNYDKILEVAASILKLAAP